MSSLQDHSGDLERALQVVARSASYADAMAEARSGYTVRVERDSVSPSQQPILRGAIFRAWTGRGWTETVARSLAAEELTRAAETLRDGLGRSNGSSAPPPGRSPTDRGEFTTPSTRPISAETDGEFLEHARRWQSVAQSMPGITNAIGSAGYFREERLFLATSGAHLRQEMVRVSASVVGVAVENGRAEYEPVIEGGTGGFEVFDRVTDEVIRESCRRSVDLLKAPEPPRGRMNVVLDPSMAGVFAHESFGHGTEADQMLRERSYLKPLLGHEVGPSSLTLVDDGSYEGGWGRIFFDDEGTRAHKNLLVDRGKFVGALHDRESAQALGAAPTGNARRADFLSRTFVRMTNTYAEPGDMSLEELAQAAGDGILLARATSGIEDPLGGQMQLKCKSAQRIEHGRLTTLYSSMALSGRVLDFLRSIQGIGKKAQFEMSPGMCGKGHTDLLPAGDGGTYILGTAVVGPA